MAYISEGLGNLNDWNMVMKYQMKNGSLFNSPSATASVLIHHQNAGCLHYLTSLLDKFGNAGIRFILHIQSFKSYILLTSVSGFVW